jgi:L-cysteine S-thiosulfotransferase
MTRVVTLAALGLLACTVASASAGTARSGYDDATPATRAMQDDDAANPGFLWVQQGEAIWNERAGPDGQSCATCHGAPTTMRGVAARYPAFEADTGRPETLEGRINRSRTQDQHAAPFAAESDALLAITAFAGVQSRGLPMAVSVDERERSFYNAGRAIFETRMGQLNLSCAQCHDQLAGQRLAGALIPQGQPNGYPLYRLEWQSMGSFYRRIRNCMTGVRAEPFDVDAVEVVDLELFLAVRSGGLRVETPAVRP